LRGDDYRKDRELYYQYIARQRDDVLAVLQRMGELEVLREEVLKEATEEFKARLLDLSTEP
jgi:hypothetical protein